MTNLTDKNLSQKASLFQLNNSISHCTDYDLNSMGSALKSQGINGSKKIKIDNQGKASTNISSFDQNYNQSEIINNLKKALTEAMDENIAVTLFKIQNLMLAVV